VADASMPITWRARAALARAMLPYTHDQNDDHRGPNLTLSRHRLCIAAVETFVIFPFFPSAQPPETRFVTRPVEALPPSPGMPD
jgi:hypothetical protein